MRKPTRFLTPFHTLQDAEGKDVYRSYTPVSVNNLKGRVDFVIKLYPQVWIKLYPQVWVQSHSECGGPKH